jgi:hypothetical protein
MFAQDEYPAQTSALANTTKAPERLVILIRNPPSPEATIRPPPNARHKPMICHLWTLSFKKSHPMSTMNTGAEDVNKEVCEALVSQIPTA